MRKGKLRAVPDPVEKPLEMAGDIYADVRALAHDPARWERMHVAAHRRDPLDDIHQPPHKRFWTTWRR